MVAASLNAGPANEVSIEGLARVRLTDFGLKPPTTALGAIGTRNEMAFHFVLTAAPFHENCFAALTANPHRGRC